MELGESVGAQALLAKSPGFEPENVGAFSVIDVFPVLVMVTNWLAEPWPTVMLPNEREPGEIVAPVCVPKPESVTMSGVVTELEAMENWPVRFPAESGEKTPLMVQVALTASDVQLSVSEKLPVGVMLEKVSVAVPQLVTTMGREPLLLFTG